MFSELARLFGLKTCQNVKNEAKARKDGNEAVRKAVEKNLEEDKIEKNDIDVQIENTLAKTEKVALSPPKKSSHKRSHKNGIQVLSGDFDFYGAFAREEETDIPEKPSEPIQSKIITEKIEEQKARHKPLKAQKIKRDKKGIAQLSSVHNIERLMESGIDLVEEFEPKQDQKPDIKKPKESKTLKDRNKIQILSNTVDLTKAFGTDEDNGFQTMLNKNLSGKSMDALLREKKDRTTPPAPVPVEQRIKRYPGPQEELDLHGFTAIEADRKTDIFIRSTRRRGLFTVKIIVGKGTHSQGRAVLPDIVEDRLSALKSEKEVLTFRWEKRLKTQSGAVIVYLNQFD